MFFTLTQIFKLKVSNNSPEHYSPKEKMLRKVIWHLFFADLTQNEKLSEIKSPLVLVFSRIFRLPLVML